MVEIKSSLSYMAKKFEELVGSKFSFQSVALNNQTVILPKFEGEREFPQIRLPNTLLSHYGVPKIGQYFKTDSDRMFLQLPVNDDLIAHLNTLDEYLGSNTMKQELFKAPGNTYEYSPILRYGSKGPYIKLKLEKDYESGSIETRVWHSQRLTNSCIYRNTIPIDICSVDDFSNAVPLNSSVICLIRFVKVWVVNKKYGLTVKLAEINVLPGEKPKIEMIKEIEFE